MSKVMSRYYIKSRIKDLYFEEYESVGSPKFTYDISKAWKFRTENMAKTEMITAGVEYCEVVLI